MGFPSQQVVKGPLASKVPEAGLGCSQHQLSRYSHCAHCSQNLGLVRQEVRGWKKTQGVVGTADTFILSCLEQQP